MRVLCSIEDVFRSDVPGVAEVAEVDLQDRRTGTLCLCHPDVRAFWIGLATDLCKSYDIDGILFFNERNGPLLNALGASHAQSIASARVTCFCEHHQRAAKAQGIDFERARQGYQKLDQFIQARSRANGRAMAISSSSGGCWSSGRRSSRGTGCSTRPSTRCWPTLTPR